ncbi:CBS domain-containing protein [Nitrososphaera sp.]|uniref:CBS domain-containing protein n=1 Tax=Nitrososphaera sp. TaxID=1971748 RepID=UPI00307DBB4E
MSTKVETIDLLETAYEAAKKMQDKRISSVIVVDKKNQVEVEPLGIITERDLVHRVCAQGISSKEKRANEIMSFPIATIDPRATVETAADLMLANKVRHLIVMNADRKMVGILAPSDLNKYLRSNMDMDEVKARILQGLIDEQEMGAPL